MTKYTYRPNVVEAFHYQGEHISELPAWVQDWNLGAPSPYGNSKVGTSATHDLLIPTVSGVLTVRKGDWVVLENERLFAVRDPEFQKIFESAEAPGAQDAAPTE